MTGGSASLPLRAGVVAAIHCAQSSAGDVGALARGRGREWVWPGAAMGVSAGAGGLGVRAEGGEDGER